ncbi:MAG: hypothetical protein EXR73_03610 [Myxococcales bacterium]|nr:hypothetical protein [Myxococcales bacterium]
MTASVATLGAATLGAATIEFWFKGTSASGWRELIELWPTVITSRTDQAVTVGIGDAPALSCAALSGRIVAVTVDARWS